MKAIRIEGGYPIQGTVRVEGAKNSALKLMAATIIAPGRYCLSRIPNISDVSIMASVLRTLGAQVSVLDHALEIDTTSVNKVETPYELVRQMRASIAVLGPLLARFGEARVAMPGGCQIGERKLDLHMAGLQALGVEFTLESGYIHAKAPAAGMQGGEVHLDFASVGATENLMMAAVCAHGTTVINNAAREPEIVDLATMLNKMGAYIEGAGTPRITIEGKVLSDLHSCDHETVGDRIEAGTYLAAGALSGGPVTVEGVNPQHLGIVLKKFEACGCAVSTTENSITIQREQPLKAVDIQTLPFPGFPTDMQAQFTVIACKSVGNSIITENVFENRFMLAGELSRMGSDIRIEGHHALVQGERSLSGAQVASTDLRGGAALILAGLVSEGVTEVSGVRHIERGYERVVEKFRSLGAHIEYVEHSDEDLM